RHRAGDQQAELRPDSGPSSGCRRGVLAAADTGRPLNRESGRMDTAPAAALGSIDIQRLLEVLPHRYPFLIVDRIERIDGVNSAVGIKNVTINEPHFAGHFPGRPIMPGVLWIEVFAQTAGAICIHALVSSK